MGTKTSWVIAALVAATLTAGTAQATVVVYAAYADAPLVPGASLSDVSMSVDMEVSDGWATMTFTNTSSGVGVDDPVSIAEIVLDVHDGDDPDGDPILWDPVILTDTRDVSFDWGGSNGLPGYNDVTVEDVPLIEMSAGPPPTKRGLNIGESLQVRFATWLTDGSDEFDYLAALGGGDDTGLFAIGFHAVSAGIVNEESLSGILIENPSEEPVPEPSSAMLVGLGTMGLMLKRRQQRRNA